MIAAALTFPVDDIETWIVPPVTSLGFARNQTSTRFLPWDGLKSRRSVSGSFTPLGSHVTLVALSLVPSSVLLGRLLACV